MQGTRLGNVETAHDRKTDGLVGRIGAAAHKTADRNPEISVDGQRHAADQRSRLANLINLGLCEELIRCDPSVDSIREQFRHALDLKLLAIYSMPP